jgi:hypothetical protein
MVLVSCAQVLSEVSWLMGALDTVIAGMGGLIPAVLFAICIVGAGGLVVLLSLVVVRSGSIGRSFAQTRFGSRDFVTGRVLKDE